MSDATKTDGAAVPPDDATDAMEQSATTRETSREAVLAEEDPQDFAADHEPAESRTAFGDDKITPHLNDGR